MHIPGFALAEKVLGGARGLLRFYCAWKTDQSDTPPAQAPGPQIPGLGSRVRVQGLGFRASGLWFTPQKSALPFVLQCGCTRFHGRTGSLPLTPKPSPPPSPTSLNHPPLTGFEEPPLNIGFDFPSAKDFGRVDFIFIAQPAPQE